MSGSLVEVTETDVAIEVNILPAPIIKVEVAEVGRTGPPGPEGIQGDQGPQGPQGVQGEVGPQGVQGETGPQGIEGPQGVQGFQGDVGPQGIQGPQGETGDTGPQGAGLVIKGTLASVGDLPASGNVEGDAYAVGITSPRDIYVWDAVNSEWDNVGPLEGPQGDVGPQGPQGIQGEAGPQGQQGIQGETGQAGPPGTTDYNDLENRPALGTAAATDAADYATAAQGETADTALQPSTFPLASQAEAEAGTQSSPRRFSPLRIAQAVAALGAGGGGLSDPFETTFTNVSAVDFALPAGFWGYRVLSHIAKSSNTATLDMRASANDGASFFGSSAYEESGGGITDRISLGDSFVESTLDINVIGAGNPNTQTVFKFELANNLDQRSVKGSCRQHDILNALRIFTSSGTISGTILVYGLEGVA